jgi:hypothetical protein
MQHMRLFKKKIFINFSFLLLIMLTAACQKEEVVPTTGDLKIEVRRTELMGVTYNVYSEAYLSSNSYFPPITKGTINSNTITIQGLNEGNYILQLDAGHNRRIFLQVTAGKERTFYIE